MYDKRGKQKLGLNISLNGKNKRQTNQTVPTPIVFISIFKDLTNYTNEAMKLRTSAYIQLSSKCLHPTINHIDVLTILYIYYYQ
jgi:hypothetical protein